MKNVSVSNYLDFPALILFILILCVSLLRLSQKEMKVQQLGL